MTPVGCENLTAEINHGAGRMHSVLMSTPSATSYEHCAPKVVTQNGD